MAAKAAGLDFDDFHRWSEGGANYGGESDCRAAWRSFKIDGRVTAATLFGMAIDAGWRDQRAEHGGRPTDRRESSTAPAKKAVETRTGPLRPDVKAGDVRAAWEAAQPATADHAYVRRKLMLPFGLRVRQSDGALLVPVQDADGELQSLQSIPAEPGGKKLNFKGAPMSGGRFVVGGPIEAGGVYLSEGVAAAMTAHQATGRPAVCCFGVGNVARIAADLHARHPDVRLIIVADRGKEAVSEKIAADVGGAFVGLPESMLANSDINDVHVEQGMEAAAALLARATEPRLHGAEQAVAEDVWPEPANIFREVSAPAFDREDVPAPIHAMASAFAAATGFDYSGAVVAATVAAAAVIDDRWRLAVRPASEWFESARLWATLIGTPSAGKSPTIRAATDPIKRLHAEMFAAWLKTNEGKKDNEREPMPCVFASDATVEALSDILKDNPRGLLMLTEEFASWIGGIDAYKDGSGSKNRGEWLQLYDGGPHQVLRVRKGAFLVPNWSASVLAACTPAGLRDQLRKLPDDGLIQRFIPCLMGPPKNPEASSARDALRDWEIRLREVFAKTTCTESKGRARISVSAQIEFDAETKVIRESVDSLYEISPPLSSHIGKHPGMLARVSLVFHLVEGRLGDAIERDTMLTAIRFMRKVRRHSAALYLGLLSASPAFDIARGIARAIVADAGRPTAIGRNYMTQHCRPFRQADDLARRLSVQALEDAGWLSPVPGSRAYGGWGASEWSVNPRVFDQFATEGQALRERRAVVLELFAGGA